MTSRRHHRGHPVSEATRRKESAREKGRHHKGHKRTAAQRAAASKREKGRKHPHRGVKGHHHRAAKRKSTTRRKTLRHRTTRHATTTGGARHVTRSVRRAPRSRRERIYPSRFTRGHTRVHARFYRGKRARALRAPFVAGRRHLRQWK